MIDNLLERLTACPEAREWAKGKTWQECYATCERGDWMLWLFVRTNPRNKRLRVLTAGHCANTVRHLMTDPRSLAVVDAAIAYGEGRIGIAALHKAREESSAATAVVAEAAWAAEAAADAARAEVAASQAWAAWAAEAEARAEAAEAAWAAARQSNQRETADIVRWLIPIEKWNVIEDDGEVAK